MNTKWAVLVVHGVGDTGPGVTVDAFVAAMNAVNPNFKPDGSIEVHYLEDAPTPVATSDPRTRTTTRSQGDETVSLFPMHVRRASLKNGSGEPTKAVFGEVYWSDIASVGEGWLGLLWGFLTTTFSMRCISDQAAAVPTWPAFMTRLSINVASWLLCGPVAALSAFLATALIAYYWLILPIETAISPSYILPPRGDVPERWAMVIVSVLATGVGLFARRRCITQNWGTNWRRFWSAFTAVPFIAVILAAVEYWLPALSRAHLYQKLDHAIQIRSPFELQDWHGLPRYLGANFVAIKAGFLLIDCFLVVTLIAATTGLVLYPGRFGRPFQAAIMALLVQIGIWMIAVPITAVSEVNLLLPRDGDLQPSVTKPMSGSRLPVTRSPKHVSDDLVGHVRLGLAGNFISLMVLFAVIGSIWRRRAKWVKKPMSDKRQQPIPRLIVNHRIMWTLVILASIMSFRFVAEFLYPLENSSFKAFSGIADAAISFIVAALGVAVALMSRDVRAALHVFMDIVNHFYRRWEPRWERPIPAATDVVDIEGKDYEIQHRIEERFRRVLVALLSEPGMSHLTIVSHSQGTVIAVDVLSLYALKGQHRTELECLLGRLRKFHLVTMGSPLTHLYQYYFPFRYPSLAHDSWAKLRSLVTSWINIYRADDFVGTFVESAERNKDQDKWDKVKPWAGAQNYEIGPGGHTQYWRGRDVAQLLQEQKLVPS